MSTFRNPVGPQSPQVYWRRRLLVGLGLLAVVVVVLLIVFRPAGAANDEKEPTADDAATSTTEPADEAAQEEGAACNPENVEVTAVTDKTEYASGQQPMISMSIVNNGSVACLMNVGTDQQLFTITSGAETYWESTDCQTAPAEQQVALEPGVAQATTPIPWDRTRSDPDTCENDRPSVPAGGASYHLTVSLGEIKSEGTAQFLLR
jgi:hypothetical protein